MVEEIRSVPGYDGIFATNQGRILRRHKETGDLVEVSLYSIASFSEWDSVRKKRIKHQVPVHRLVAMAFHGEPPQGKNLVRHLDGKSTNNSASNLAWGNYEENYQDAVKHGKSMPRNPKRKRAKKPQINTVVPHKRAKEKQTLKILGKQLSKARKREKWRYKLLRVPKSTLLSDCMKGVVSDLYSKGYGYKRIAVMTGYPLNGVQYEVTKLRCS